MTPIIRLGLFTLLCLLLQTANGQSGPDAAAEAEATWQAPRLADLPIDWWEQFDAPSPRAFEQRLAAFTTAAAQEVAGLDGADLLAADKQLQNLRGQFDLLTAARRVPEPEAFEPVVTREVYTLDELLELRRVLYGLHAILELHFAQEDEGYLSLVDEPDERVG